MQLLRACEIKGTAMTQETGVIDAMGLLRAAGIPDATIDSVLEIDAVLQKWRRRAMRREIGHRALTDLKVGIDLAQFDVLVAIDAPANEFGETAGSETMVATVAERLAIDPSRASRVVSEMVELGYAKRAVSQADARRTIIELTEAGLAVVEAVRAYKFLLMGDFLKDWESAELAAFVPLLQRFEAWGDDAVERTAKFSGDIEGLAASVARTRKVMADVG